MAVRPDRWLLETVFHLEPAPATVALLGASDVEIFALHGLTWIGQLGELVPLLQDDPEYRRAECVEHERKRCVIGERKTPKEVFLRHRFYPGGIHEDLQS